MPKASIFGIDLHPTLFDKAAAYLFHIVCNYPFNDGNKRTGGFSSAVFLEINGISTDFSDAEYENLIIKVAKGISNKAEIAHIFNTTARH